MKRLVIGIVAVAAMTLSLAACSGTTNTASGGKPTVTLWVDTPRVPQAKAYQKLMAGKQTIKIEVIAQGDAQTKVALHNRTKSGWPDVIFGAPTDTAQFLDPSNGFAADLITENIRVNCVNPGTADTPWVARLLDQAVDPLAERVALEQRQPNGRLVTADEVASAICFLADPSQRSTTGSVLAIDGGMEGLRVAAR